ncbi:hypothetical protein B9N43_05420 [Denitratisoma sp. DHT3]|nr:hypothetical protein B9N43_05420 [Denitratisoma sp. DHT3]
MCSTAIHCGDPKSLTHALPVIHQQEPDKLLPVEKIDKKRDRGSDGYPPFADKELKLMSSALHAPMEKSLNGRESLLFTLK